MEAEAGLVFGDPVGDGAGGVVFFKIGTRDMAAGMLALGGAAIANVAGLATGGTGGAVAGVATAVLAGLRSAISGTGGAGSVQAVLALLAWHGIEVVQVPKPMALALLGQLRPSVLHELKHVLLDVR